MKIVIVGAGGLARQILDAIDACQRAGQDVEALDSSGSTSGRPIGRRA